MNDINKMVGKVLFEDKGQTAGAEMFNKGPIAGLYSEPKFDNADGKRGKGDAGDSGGEPVEKAYGTNQSKFDVDSTPGNTAPTKPNPDDPSDAKARSVVKYGGNSLYSAAAKLAMDSNKNEVKSPNVKNTTGDQTEMPK